jgi:hypothetical protein
LATYSTPWGVTWELLDQGENVIELRVTDIVGNTFYDPDVNISLFKDIEPPVVLCNQLEYGWYKVDPGQVIDLVFDAGGSSFEDGYYNNSPLKKAQYKVGTYGAWIDIFELENPENKNLYRYDTKWSIPWYLINEGVNYIFVRVFDSVDNVYESPRQLLFKRDTVGPHAPMLIAPILDCKTSDTTPQHHWHPAVDPGSNSTTSYRIQVDHTGLFAYNIVDNEIALTTFKHQQKLSPGKYHWRVQGTDAAGTTGAWSETWSFEVVAANTAEANLPPDADAGEDMVTAVNEMIEFSGLGSSDPENDPLSYLWYLDDDTKPIAASSVVSWVFSVPGIYKITLEVFDEYGGSDKDTFTITVLDTSLDSDSDGIPDAWEEHYGLDPNDPRDAAEDLDNDGYTNSLEYTQGSSPSDTLSTPASVNDDTPPEIVHTKIKHGRMYEEIKITAKVTDSDSGVKRVTLYYRSKTDKTYSSIAMDGKNPKNNKYTGTIPASMATLDDVEYYLEAVDNAKVPNKMYFGGSGRVTNRPTPKTDIDVDIREHYQAPAETNALDDFTHEFDFASFEVCFVVMIIIIILLVSFVVTVQKAVKAKRMATDQNRRMVIRVMRGDNMRWEGFEPEAIGEEEDLSFIEDDFELDNV